MLAFRPWPSLISRVERLPIQERYDEPFEKSPEIKFGAQELVLIEGAAETSASIRLVKVTVLRRLNALNVDRGQFGIQNAISFLDRYVELPRDNRTAALVGHGAVENEEAVDLRAIVGYE